MFHGGAKYSTETLKCSAEVVNIARRLPNVPRRCSIFQGVCQMFLGAPKYCMEIVKCSTEVLNIPRRLSNFPRCC